MTIRPGASRRLLAFGLAGLLSACGGQQSDHAEPAAAPRARALALATDPAQLAEIERLMNWAETAFPHFFPTREITQTADPYRYRYYPQTNTYLGVDGSFIRVLGPLSDNVVRDVGTLEDYACSVDITACEAPRFARQPVNVTVAAGAPVTFSAELAGGPSIQLQWLRNDQPVEGGGTPTLSFTATAADNGARFSLRAENAKGLVFSDTVTLTVSAAVGAAAAQRTLAGHIRDGRARN